MQKKFQVLAILIFVISIVFGSKINLAKADGGIFYPPDYYSAETTQKAFIYFANQTENLVVSASFQGNAKDFAWVIPTPNKPEINKGSAGLFNNLVKITRQTTNGPETVYGNTLMLGLSGSSKPVEVISEKTIDVYNTAILKATDENALSQWLLNHGYTFPDTQTPNLKSYVDNDWYFVVAKIKPDLIAGGGITTQLDKGTLTPLRLTFQTDKIIYPMKLTGIALTQTAAPTSILTPANTSIPITLYVLTDHKTEQKLLAADWANWLSGADIKNLNSNLGANIISGEKLFLTKMSNSVSVKDINDDFILSAASNNDVYPIPVYKTTGFWLSNLLFLILTPLIITFFPIPLGLIFIVFLLLQKYVKKKWLYIIGSIYQILACLVILTVGLLVVSASSSDLGGLWLENGFIGAFIACLAIETLAIYVTIKMLKRYKTLK